MTTIRETMVRIRILGATLQRYPDSITVRIVGTSMEPELFDGDGVLVDTSATTPRRDDVVMAWIHGRGPLVGRFRLTRTGAWLYKNNPENPSWPRVELGTRDRYFIAGTVRCIVERPGSEFIQREVTPGVGNTEPLRDEQLQARSQTATAEYLRQVEESRARHFAAPVRYEMSKAAAGAFDENVKKAKEHHAQRLAAALLHHVETRPDTRRTVQVESLDFVTPPKVGDVIDFWGGNRPEQGSRRGTVVQVSKKFLWAPENGGDVVRWDRKKMGLLGVVVMVGMAIPDPPPTLSRAEREERIRTLYLRPKASYSITEVGRLLDIPESLILKYMKEWEIENLSGKAGEIRLSRTDVFKLVRVFDFSWGPLEIEEALGDDTARAIPEPLRMQRREIALPNAVWRVFEKQWKEFISKPSAGKHSPSFERWLSWQIDGGQFDTEGATSGDTEAMMNPHLFLGKDAPGLAALDEERRAAVKS